MVTLKRLLGVFLLIASGCASQVEAERLPHAELETRPKILYVGSFYDLRRGTSSVNSTDESQRSLVDQREVRIPVSEVRSVLADAISRSGGFERVLNPPFVFAGTDPAEMVRSAQQSSDYLLVGEINQFHVKSKGYNGSAGISIPLDILFAPFAFATYLTTGGNMFLFTGSLFAAWDAEVVLTISISLVDTATGHVVHTLRLEERVTSRYDGMDAFGSLWDETDDWIDIGRRLGEVALHNSGVHLSERLHTALGPLLAAENED
jgi:hypothetical protein